MERLNINNFKKREDTSSGGNKRTIVYDRFDNIVKFVDKNNDIESYYDNHHRILKFADFKNNYEFENVYDRYGNHIYYKNSDGYEYGLKADCLNILDKLLKIDELKDKCKKLMTSIADDSLILLPDKIIKTEVNSIKFKYNKNSNYLEFEFFDDSANFYYETKNKKNKSTIIFDYYALDVFNINTIIGLFCKESGINEY